MTDETPDAAVAIWLSLEAVGASKQFDFGHSNDNWSPDVEHNLFFLKANENYFNDKLRAQGYLFLNDVLNSFAIEGTMYGQIAGWLYQKDKFDHVDLHIEDMGDNSFFLTPNVRGVIFDEAFEK